MSALVDFAKRLEAQLHDANREPHWEPDAAARYMDEIRVRRVRFEQESERLVTQIIRPRLAMLAGYFDNTSLAENEPPNHCSCWFGYCERFPASAEVNFTIEHDVRYEKTTVRYEARMIPLFTKFDECDKLTAMIGQLGDQDVSEWVEETLLGFLDAYLQIDRGSEEFDEQPATDPVCGMRLVRSSAGASDTYRGHPYFFCSRQCQEQFAREPTAYVQVKTF